VTFESDGDFEVSENVAAQQNDEAVVKVLVHSDSNFNRVSISWSQYTIHRNYFHRCSCGKENKLEIFTETYTDFHKHMTYIFKFSFVRARPILFLLYVICSCPVKGCVCELFIKENDDGEEGGGHSKDLDSPIPSQPRPQ